MFYSDLDIKNNIPDELFVYAYGDVIRGTGLRPLLSPGV